jgi:hypothetical protein
MNPGLRYFSQNRQSRLLEMVKMKVASSSMKARILNLAGTLHPKNLMFGGSPSCGEHHKKPNHPNAREQL